MPVTEKKYPDWVQKYRTRGTTVKKKGDAYYLYKRTSKRVSGKKYPQPVDTYIGVITPEGVVESNRKKLSLTNIGVREFGFSKAIQLACPAEWKGPLGEEWEDILSIIIVQWSPASYLLEERQIRREDEFHRQFPAQKSMLSRRIYNKYGIDVKDMEELKQIYLIYFEKEKVVSRINDSQKRILDRLGLGDALC